MASIMASLNGLLAQYGHEIFLALIFLTCVSLILGVATLVMRQNVVRERLGRILSTSAGPGATKAILVEKEATGLMAKVTRPLHNLAAPSEEATQKKVRLKLTKAGLRSQAAYRNYIAAKVFCAMLFASAYLMKAIFYTPTLNDLAILGVLGLAGFFLPNLVILQLTQKRQEGIFQALPDALDMMVVCVEAGLGLDLTFKKVGEEIRPLNRALSDEFFLANLEVRSGKPRDESLRNVALRTGVAEIQNLVTILIQTNRFGTSVAKALRVHADAMRTKRRQSAEEQAAKTTVKLVVPLILFIFPALFVVLIGPGAIRIIQTLLPSMG